MGDAFPIDVNKQPYNHNSGSSDGRAETKYFDA